ncbi:MAG: hypothetical protein ACYC1Z_03420 [Georgenia sp.]
MKLDELIRKVREQINARINVRNDYATKLEELRGAESVDETAVEELRSKKGDVDAEIRELQTKLEDLEKERTQDEAVARLQATTTGTPAPVDQREQHARVGQEPRTYARETDPTGDTFLRDVAADFLGNREARERLARHMQEEKVERGDKLARAITTGGAPGLVVPQYLLDLYAKKGRPGRKLADQMRKHTLPASGMTVEIPRQIAKTAVGEQAAEGDLVTEAEYDDEMISRKVRTAAGSQSISRQSVERSEGTLDVVTEDLFRAYDSDLDSMLINSATWGLLAVANAVTYTSAAPTAKELYSKIVGAKAAQEDVLLDLDEDDVFTLMRGRRWAWLKNQHTTEHPFIQAVSVPALVGGTSLDNGYAAGVRGFLPDGGPVVTDNNLPANLGTGTNEDVAVVVARQEAHLWEDPSAPVLIRAEQNQAKKLLIDLVVYGYFAAVFDRVVDAQGTPKAVHQQITGTGLVAPVF